MSTVVWLYLSAGMTKFGSVITNFIGHFSLR